MIYAWDPRKAASNLRKHGVGFTEAATVFLDPAALTFFDPDHADSEDRFITIGLSGSARHVFVSHADTDDQVRIISARRATKDETDEYTKSDQADHR